MKLICVLIVTFAFICPDGYSQSISGIVNTYHSVTEIVTSKNAVRLSSVAGLSPSDKVLLIQMKGATINTVNNSSFGDTTSLNDAGNYEIGFICRVNGDSVFLTHSMLNAYNVTGKVQLVKFARYNNATVVDTLKAASWNNTSGTGGVIALSVLDVLTLNAPVYADSAGFRGGAYVEGDDGCTNFISGYAYNGSLSVQNGANKGEGVAAYAVSVSGGRGAPANGGGGGNNHNNSGGGGANLTAGGLGGGNSSANNITICYATFRGIGGKPLNSRNGIKIFQGGGGGAGHNNNGFSSTHGGNGGGIIIIDANRIVGNGHKISANGIKGGDSQSDGAGGGGAGGSIILYVDNYDGSMSIQANGGNGATSADGGTLNRCYGGGGGGSGGVIYFKGATPGVTVNVNAGAAGIETGRDANCVAAEAAFAGSTGVITNNYTPRASAVFSSGCGVVLPIDLFSFEARAAGPVATLKWKILNPGNIDRFIVEKKNTNNSWFDLASVTASNNDEYIFTDPYVPGTSSFYRLRIISRNGSISYSRIRMISGVPQHKLVIYPNPAISSLTVITGKFPAKMVISDLTGKEVLNRMIYSNDVDLPYLKPGVYIIQVNDQNEKLVIRQ